MGIAIVGFAGDHYGGVIPSSAGHLTVVLTTDDLLEILLAREEHLDILVESSPAIITDIDDDPLLTIILPQDIGVDIAEAGVSHRRDMDIA